MPTSSCATRLPDRRRWRRQPSAAGLVRGVTAVLLACVCLWAQAATFDLTQYRLRAATDRAAGLAEGWRELDRGTFANDPAGERLLLWYMGAAASGSSNDEELDAITARLDRLAQDRKDEVAQSYAGFLRGGRLIDAGDARAGLVLVLESANRIFAQDDAQARITAAGELCSAYVSSDLPQAALEHCARYRRLVHGSQDAAAMARADYLDASALSRAGLPEQAIERWNAARTRFLALGLKGLAARTAGSMAGDLVIVGRHAEALEMAQEALDAALAVSSAISTAIARGIRAEALIGLGRHDEARVELDQAMSLIETMDQPFLLGDLLMTRTRLLEATEGDTPRSRELRARAQALKDTGMQSGRGEELESLELKFREREQQLQIRELETERRAQELALQQVRLEAERSESALARQQQILWVIALLGMLLAAGLVVVLRLLSAQRRLADALQAQANRDALTGIPNRRVLNEVAATLLAEPACHERGHVLMMADLDHFKPINDRYGHPFGDQVLATVAALLQSSVPPTALVVRMGGEEFALLCPELGRSGARQLADSICAAVAALELEARGERVRVTISIGAAVYSEKVADFSTWLRAADAALYRAKAAGRNRVDMAPD